MSTKLAHGFYYLLYPKGGYTIIEIDKEGSVWNFGNEIEESWERFLRTNTCQICPVPPPREEGKGTLLVDERKGNAPYTKKS